MSAPRRLPIVPRGVSDEIEALSSVSPCFECRAPCCAGPAVSLQPYDLYRLVRALGVPWQLLAQAHEAVDGPVFLDERRRVDFRLRQHGGACVLLLQLSSGHGRCGAHMSRPSRCRIYPFHVEVYRRSADYDVAVGTGAVCPPDSLARWAAVAADGLDDARNLIDDEIAEHALTRRLMTRWDLARRAAPMALDSRHFVAFCERIYAILDEVRRGPRAGWQLDAYQIVDAFPLTVPSLLAS